MSNEAKKQRLAERVEERWITFQSALSNKRKYPTAEFNAFAGSAKEYMRALGSDPLIHRKVANVIAGLVEFLRVERRRVPSAILQEADRIETIVFGGYDPHF